MSAVALDRQYRWRSNLQDLSSHLQPPAPLPRSTCILNYPRQPTHSIAAGQIISSHLDSSFGHSHALQSQSVLPTPSHIFNYPNPSSLTSTHTPITQQSTTQSSKRDCNPNPSLNVKMHAQVTSASLAVSTIEDIAAPRKLSSGVLSSEHIYEPQSLAPSSPHTSCNSNTTTITTTVLCQASDTKTFTNASPNTTSLAHFTATNHESTESSDENQSNCCCRAKSYSKCSSRNSVVAKNKGGCFQRRRLIDEEGYIRRAACVCVNKEETQVLLVSSKKDPCAWLVPGGGLEAGEDTVTAAKREAWEEAGIQGDIARYLGLFESFHHSGVKKHRTAVYIFVVTEEHTDFPEARLGRRRQWFSMDEALLHLARHRPLQSAYLQFLMMSKLKVAAAS